MVNKITSTVIVYHKKRQECDETGNFCDRIRIPSSSRRTSTSRDDPSQGKSQHNTTTHRKRILNANLSGNRARHNRQRHVLSSNSSEAELLDRNLICNVLSSYSSPMGPNAHRSRSISDVSSLSTVSVLRFDPIRLRAPCVEESQLGCICSG